MKAMLKLAASLAIASACSSASAGVVSFESFMPGIYSGGDTLDDGEQHIIVRGENIFDGALINGRDPFSCDVATCPAGNATNYYVALNDGGFSLRIDGDHFNVTSLDFGFVLPVDTLVGFSVGRLVATGDNGRVVYKDFDLQNSAGDYVFSNWDLSNSALGGLREVTFNACLYNGSGDCVNPANYQAQFAVDNLNYYVPEPGSMALIGLSMAGMFAARRRKSA